MPPAADFLAEEERQQESLAELLEHLGGISTSRIRRWPAPGMATEQDALELRRRENRRFELVNGVLVEKGVSFRNSCLAAFVRSRMWEAAFPANLGLVTGQSALLRLLPGQVRIPDVAFVSWERIPGRKMPTEPIPSLAPDLAVEVLSRSNTVNEMAREPTSTSAPTWSSSGSSTRRNARSRSTQRRMRRRC